MTERRKTVMGVHCPPPRPTLGGGLWLALVVTLPVGGVLGLIQIGLWLSG